MPVSWTLQPPVTQPEANRSQGVEEQVCRLRRSKRWGPVMISLHTGVPFSTVWKILARHDSIG